MKIISPVYKFINSQMGDLSFNSREKAIYAMKKQIELHEDLVKSREEYMDDDETEQLKELIEELKLDYKKMLIQCIKNQIEALKIKQDIKFYTYEIEQFK